MKNVLFANFAALSYTYFETVKKNRDIKTVIFDDKKKNANKLNVKSNHIFMAYSECEKWETPLWDDEFDGWNYLTSSGKRDNTYCVAFKKDSNIIIAFRGTDDIDDVVEDVNLGLFDKWSDCIEVAIDFVESIIRNYPNDNLYFTGHSLGGAIAQIVGKIFNKETVTFNALGADVLCNGTSVPDIEDEIICHHIGCRDKVLRAKIFDTLSKNRDCASVIDGIIINYNNSNTNSFNVIEGNIGNLKIEIGVNSKRQESVNQNIKPVGKYIVKYLKYAELLAKNNPKCTNYIIGGDWTATVSRHYGELVVLGDTKHEYRTGIMRLTNPPSFGVHSMGWFLLFMDDAGCLRHPVRPVFTYNILRDVCDSKSIMYREKTLHSMLKAVSRNSVDLANNEAILLSEDKKFWKRYRLGTTFRNIMRHSIFFSEIDNPFIIGKFCNCCIDGIDGRLEPVKIHK